jgi:hypothetical protein
MDAEDYAALFEQTLITWDGQRARSTQVKVGPSEIGFCRQKVALKIKETPKTDSGQMSSAMIGTAIHAMLEQARGLLPNLILERELTIDLRVDGFDVLQLVGHADEIDPDENSITDWKTVDGFEWVKRHGPSQAHKFQRHLYALGAIQAGLVKEEGLIVRNAYIDRSGKDPSILVWQEAFDPTLTDEVGQWVADVLYAVKHGEDASRDIAAPTCEAISCEYFTACRGGLLPDTRGDQITDADTLDTLVAYLEGAKMEKDGKRLKTEMKERLAGIDGIGVTALGPIQVRHTTIGASYVAGYEKATSERIDVRPVKLP